MRNFCFVLFFSSILCFFMGYVGYGFLGLLLSFSYLTFINVHDIDLPSDRKPYKKSRNRSYCYSPSENTDFEEDHDYCYPDDDCSSGPYHGYCSHHGGIDDVDGDNIYCNDGTVSSYD